VDCHITYTNPTTHALIRDNLHRSPLYTGRITSIGPRYCPSIEDKIVRFADRDRHQIFVEPEGRDHPWIYLNGVSTSLPADVQTDIVRSIRGLQRADVARPGYAVEYDFVQPTACRHTLETKSVRGLFLAGQINGTTGYEEAAALGLVAGINAALAVRGEEPLVLSRGEAYIGVLVDDLVLKGTAEPYRMFTSRAEYRLLLDIDSADLRLTEYGRRIGLIGDGRYARFVERRDAVRDFARHLETLTLAPRGGTLRRTEERLGVRITEPTTPARLLRRGDVTIEALESLLGDGFAKRLRPRDRRYVANRLRYGGYVLRQERDLERLRREEGRRIPTHFEYEGIPGLSREVVEKLDRARPETLAQAARISGITPAALSLINVYLEKARRAAATSGPGTDPSRPPRRTDSRYSAESSDSPTPPPPADRE
jgi:tRNA uridine 5-carboxymethylaminomethyl modification enzyme